MELPTLIGVFPVTKEDLENLPGKVGFVYSIDRPGENLWVSQRCEDGTLAGHKVMAMGLNALVRQSDGDQGDEADIEMEGDYSLRFTVGEIIDRDEIQAYQADPDMPVRLVRIDIIATN